MATPCSGSSTTPAILAVELEIDGTWRRFPVNGAGYAVRSSASDAVPTGYRWLDAAGQVVHAVERPSPVGP